MKRRGRLRLPGHVERKANGDYVKSCTTLVMEVTAPVRRPRQNTLFADMRLLKVAPPPPRRPRKKEMEGHRTA